MSLKVSSSMFTGKKVVMKLKGVSTMNIYDRGILLAKFMKNFEQNFKTQGFQYNTLTGTFINARSETSSININFDEAVYEGDNRSAEKFKKMMNVLKMPVASVKEIPYVIISKRDLTDMYIINSEKIEQYLITFKSLSLKERLWKTYTNVRIPNSVDASVDVPSVSDVGYNIVDKICRNKFPDAYKKEKKDVETV